MLPVCESMAAVASSSRIIYESKGRILQQWSNNVTFQLFRTLGRRYGKGGTLTSTYMAICANFKVVFATKIVGLECTFHRIILEFGSNFARYSWNFQVWDKQ